MVEGAFCKRDKTRLVVTPGSLRQSRISPGALAETDVSEGRIRVPQDPSECTGAYFIVTDRAVRGGIHGIVQKC